MTTTLVCLLWVVVILIGVPIAILCIELLFATSRRRASGVLTIDRPRVAVLMPAHNEAAGIERTVRSLLPQLSITDRLVVVADNCSDDTAAIAAAAGAVVIIRTDATQRGKGYALDYGVRYLEQDPPEVVIILDADCEAAAGAMDRIARMCAITRAPVQALYLMKSPRKVSAGARIAEFAWIIKNRVRPLGLSRLRLPCQLMGTGMAFTWDCIQRADLATGHLVEDLKLGVELARAGSAPLFCPEAEVSSTFPTSDEGTRSQRTRWEHGHLSIILGEAPRLIWHALRTGNLQLLSLALDMAVPPLTLLLLLSVVGWLAALGLFLVTGRVGPLALASVLESVLGLSLLLAWMRFGRTVVSGRDLWRALVYAFSKIPLYVKFLFARQVQWVRSQRDDHDA